MAKRNTLGHNCESTTCTGRVSWDGGGRTGETHAESGIDRWVDPAPFRFQRLAETYPSTALIMLKIGRYMATIMPPTTTPSTTIITGSMRDSRVPTAVSTSSS